MSDTKLSGLNPSDIERPAGSASDGGARYGSDVAAETLRALEILFVALNPGSSYRGLHDSIVNHLGNERPQMLVCLHEESAVALAHGWAKVTGRPMAAAVHSNVGLFHATMAVFNAWCDRVPLLLLGATGPVDAPKRRPWIDWIHTAQDQGAILRNYLKWDAQPASAAAVPEALARAAWLAGTAPMGPVYVNFDAGMQEAALTEPPPALDMARFRPRPDGSVSAAAIDQAVAMLREARDPVIDGDGQHDAGDVERIVDQIGPYDMVVGTRSHDSHEPLVRRPGKLVLTVFANFLAGVKIPDVNSGLRVQT